MSEASERRASSFGHELVRIERVGRNPRVITARICYGPEAGREVGVRVRDSRNWYGLIGKEIEVRVGSMEPWVYQGKEPGRGQGDARRLSVRRRFGR